MKRELKVGDETVVVRTEQKNGVLEAMIGDTDTLTAPLTPTGPGSALLTMDGKRHRVAAVEHGDAVWVAVDGRVWRFDKIDPDADAGGAGGVAENMVAAPMPGKVIKVLAEVGAEVKEGQPVLIVEAMKMEHTLRAPMNGIVTELHCAEGDQVDPNVPLIEIEAAE